MIRRGTDLVRSEAPPGALGPVGPTRRIGANALAAIEVCQTPLERSSRPEALLPDHFDDLGPCRPGTPCRDDRFKVLTGRGASPPGGKYDYVINGNRITGFSLVVWPADDRASGVMTLLNSHQSKLLEEDLGLDPAKTVAAITEYNPDEYLDAGHAVALGRVLRGADSGGALVRCRNATSATGVSSRPTHDFRSTVRGGAGLPRAAGYVSGRLAPSVKRGDQPVRGARRVSLR